VGVLGAPGCPDAATTNSQRRLGDPDGRLGKAFLVIRRAGMNLYADPPGTRLEEAGQITTAPGGSSANIAAGLTRLGCDAALVTRVSDDAVGRFCLNRLDD
jgi:5-dehydro-2-deoxygluconokinase